MNDFRTLLDRFAEVRREGDGNYAVPCPAHSDSNPSLVLAVKADGRLLLHCRAGCSRADVVRSLGMHPRDLFGWTAPEGITAKHGDAGQGPGPSEIAALRVYVDATSMELFEGETDAAKRAADYLYERFGMDADRAAELGIGVDAGGEHPMPHVGPRFARYPRITVPLADGDGVYKGLQGRDISGECPTRWVSLSNPDGMAWSRYGILRGRDDYGVTVITEGPSDALTVAAMGYRTVAVRGASLVSHPGTVKEIADAVDGWVLVAGDSDDAGAGFTTQLVDALSSHGKRAAALTLPDGVGDVADWKAATGSRFPGAFHQAVKDAEPEPPAEDDGLSAAGQVEQDDAGRATDLLRTYTERYGPTSVGLAYTLVAYANGRIKYAPGLGFMAWDGRVWRQSETRVRQELHHLGAALTLAGRTSEAKAFLTTSLIGSILEELQAIPQVHVSAAAFDTHAHLLTVRNGTIDLRSGVLRAHSQRDLLTHCLDVDYDPDAEAPRWNAFLREIFPERPELTDYLQRLVGYGVTGSTAEQCFTVLWGRGANGKSVFMDTLEHVFNPITSSTPFSTFEERPNGGIPNDLAALRGARLVRASEGDRGKPMAEGVIKQATGGNSLTARFLRKEFFTFTPSFLLMMDTNHQPKFKGQDDGLWRRVKLIPFERRFAPHEREHALDLKLRREAKGILAWAVRGAVEWYRNGLQDPESVQAATKDYRATSDTLSGFFPGVLVESTPEDRVLGSDAFNAYLEWCDAENLGPRERWSRQFFYSAMEERGVYRKKTKKGIALFGVRLAGPGDAPMDADITVPATPQPVPAGSVTDIFGQAR